MMLSEDELKDLFKDQVRSLQSAKAAEFVARTKTGKPPSDTSEQQIQFHFGQNLLKDMGGRIFGDDFRKELEEEGKNAWRETLRYQGVDPES